ncbi:cytochrome c biogenesis protein CcsA [Rhodothermus profundi]|uniref:Cytochrome c-type biogenesis protein CcmF n=1 Tax=Rhodothermus profundi TaxID=633813 RepID=A0A1M6QI97_9BACT|nr:cytochrome c biogenesis protein CcsA [Rhodothermus profundi]SHK19961.1 cytochrome c-type biogenesis protein CcmF [Rhodothermus profundi]
MIGVLGHLAVLSAFVACVLAGLAYWQAARQRDAFDWIRLARGSWHVMFGATVVASGALLYLILTHQFQYAYVYQYSSRDLPLHYLISSFWAGQEGSFLLWILYTGLLGFGMMRWSGRFEAPAMAVIALSQAFLLSMVIGVKLGPLTIGSSPFQLLVERFPDAPIFRQNPGFVPADGNGLNDLLLNPWMTAHPPTLFVGFAAMAAPFALAIAALWQRRYREWIRVAMPWMLFAVLALGAGILLGGYWAYETLSFGGYWAWDPVENSSLVPWITGVAALHAMLIQRRSGRAYRMALVLTLVSYVLVIYSTFLTRSGILGDLSVHSFVDLGLHNQLLVWIASMILLGGILLVARYRELPAPADEPPALSREAWIFIGALLLTITALVILVGTSAPILGKLFRDNPASVATSFYNQWTLPLAVVFTFLMGAAQLIWWHKMEVDMAHRLLWRPLALSVGATLAVLLGTPFVEHTVRPLMPSADSPMAQADLLGGLTQLWQAYGYSLLLLLLVFASFFAFFGNLQVLWRIGRGNPRLAGGALSHVGLAIMLLGVVASSGFSLPLPHRGVPPAFRDEERTNFVLVRDEPRRVGGYEVRYEGRGLTPEGHTFYRLSFTAPDGRTFTLKPVAYQNRREEWILHPDIKLSLWKDLFVAVSPAEMFEQDSTFSEKGGELVLARGDSVVLGRQEFALRFVGFDTQVDPSLLPDSTTIAVAAVLHVTNLQTQETRILRPVYLVRADRSVQYIQTRVRDWNLAITFTSMNVSSGEITLAIEGVDVMPDDWIVVQAYEKPLINLVWLGFLLMSGGIGLALMRRARELRPVLRR